MTYVHGLTESQALTLAAQYLSDVEEGMRREMETYGLLHLYTIRASMRLSKARKLYDEAYQKYTNPFGVNKWAQ